MQVNIKNLTFSNMFSFGEAPTTIHFSDKVTQLVGENGAGKSSIPAILEDLFFNKTSRGVKKGAICNRYTQQKTYYSESDFSIGLDQYTLSKKVGSTASVKLTKNGEDISGHTATQTYQIVSELFGMDFNTFSKIVNQSILSSLDFLSATDANRKKFLISLLSLEKYTEAQEAVKKELSEIKTLFTSADSKVSTLSKYISDTETTKLELQTEIIVPEEVDHSSRIQELKTKLAMASATNSAILKEQKKLSELRAARDKLPTTVVFTEADKQLGLDNLDSLSKRKQTILVQANSLVKEINALKSTPLDCPTCKRPYENVHKSHVDQAIAEKTTEYTKYKQEVDELNKEISNWTQYVTDVEAYLKAASKVLELESNIDMGLATSMLVEELLLQKEVKNLEAEQVKNRQEIRQAQEYNNRVAVENAKVEQKLEQLAKFKSDLSSALVTRDKYKEKLDILDVLAASLGTKGLIAYKIESLVKVFEGLINEYLQVLSNGNYLITFELDDSKLAIKVYDSSEEIELSSLSSGEYNKVNTATLLAVRKMLSAISKVNLNVLFLDEVVSVLDTNSKDTLIELLLKEDLNSFVVSHGYIHPLASKLELVKEGKISRIKE